MEIVYRERERESEAQHLSRNMQLKRLFCNSLNFDIHILGIIRKNSATPKYYRTSMFRQIGSVTVNGRQKGNLHYVLITITISGTCQYLSY